MDKRMHHEVASLEEISLVTTIGLTPVNDATAATIVQFAADPADVMPLTLLNFTGSALRRKNCGDHHLVTHEPVTAFLPMPALVEIIAGYREIIREWPQETRRQFADAVTEARAQYRQALIEYREQHPEDTITTEPAAAPDNTKQCGCS